MDKKKYIAVRKSHLVAIGAMVLVYALAFAVGRWLWTECYTLNWLATNGPYWIAAAISCIPLLFGKWKYASCAFAGNVIGVMAGELCGANMEGADVGASHYGWLIWGCLFVTAVLVGVMAELICKIIKERKG